MYKTIFAWRNNREFFPCSLARLLLKLIQYDNTVHIIPFACTYLANAGFPVRTKSKCGNKVENKTTNCQTCLCVATADSSLAINEIASK